MAPVRFALQAVLVVALIVLVGFPEQRRVGAGALPKDAAAASRTAAVQDQESYQTAGARTLIGYGSASSLRIGNTAASALLAKLYQNDVEGQRRKTPVAIHGMRGEVNGIMGYARGTRNLPIGFARLVLRDTANGRLEARAIANESGRFAFVDVMPSRYVVELLNANGDVVATSELVQIGVGEVKETVVSRASRAMLASFGGTLRPMAAKTVEAASSQAVTRFTAPERCASPPCDGSNP
jgi:hypothetical protein